MARTMQVSKKRQSRPPTEKALHKAIESYPARAKWMLTRFPELGVNKPVKGATALIYACIMGRGPIVKILLDKGKAAVNARHEKYGSTALMIACSMQSIEIVKLLLTKAGIDLNVISQDVGYTALMYAVRQGYADVVEALVGKPDLEVNSVSKEGKTALMYAAEAGDLPIVESLLKHETINTALTDKKGKTALDLAVKRNVKIALRAWTTQLPSSSTQRAALASSAPRPHMSSAVSSSIATILRGPAPQQASVSRGAPFAPVHLTSDAEDESNEESEENEGSEEVEGNEGGGSLNRSSDEDEDENEESASVVDADVEESRIVSYAESNESDTGSASSSSSSSSSDLDSVTDDESAMPAQEVGGSSAISRAAYAQQARAPAPERTWLAVRLLEAGYGEQDVTICERRLINEQPFVSEAVYGMSTSLDSAVLVSIGIKQLGLRAFLLDLHGVLHLKRSAAMVDESRATKRQRSA